MYPSTTPQPTQEATLARNVREQVRWDARKGVQVRGGFTPHSQALQDRIVSRRAQPGQLLPTDIRVWQYLFDRYNEPRNTNNPRWMPTQAQIAADLRMSQATVCSSLKRLEQGGLLERGEQKGSSGWKGAKLFLPDYTPRAKSHPDPDPDLETVYTFLLHMLVHHSFFAYLRSRNRIGTDSETESQISCDPFNAPNDPNLNDRIPPTTQVVVVDDFGENCKPNIAEETIEEAGSEFSAPRRKSQRPHFSELELQAYTLMVEFRVVDARRVANHLKARGRLNAGYVAALIAYTMEHGHTPPGLFHTLAMENFVVPKAYWRTAEEPTMPVSAAVPVGPPADDRWVQVQAALSEQVPRTEYDTWIKETRLIQFEDGVAIIGTPNIFAREKLEGFYLSAIEQALLAVLGSAVVRVQIVIDSGQAM